MLLLNRKADLKIQYKNYNRIRSKQEPGGKYFCRISIFLPRTEVGWGVVGWGWG